jgi:hypothetical protein
MTPTTDDQDLAGLPYLRLGSQLYTGRGGLAYGLSNRTSMSAEYTFQWIRFDPNADIELSRLRGGYSNGGGLSLSHRLDERLSVGGSYSFVMSEQTTRNLSAQVQRAQAQAGWRLGDSTGVSGGVGLSHIYVPETGRDVTGPAYSASIGHQAGRVSLSASYDEAYVATITLGSAQAHRGVTGSASMPLRRGRMHIAGAVGYRKTHPVIGSDGIGLETLSVSGTLGLNATRWMRAELFYNGNFQQSTARGQYDRTRVGVQFVTFKPVRIQ